MDLGILGSQFLSKVAGFTAIPLATLRGIRKEINRKFTAILKARAQEEAARKRARQREKQAQRQVKMVERRRTPKI